jgi:hypothetical protein
MSPGHILNRTADLDWIPLSPGMSFKPVVFFPGDAVGDDACVIHIEADGPIEYLDDDGNVVRHTDATTARASYLDWCARTGTAVDPDLAGAAAVS